MKVTYKGASCGLWIKDNEIVLHSLYTEIADVNKGYASLLLKAIKKMAKKTGKVLRLWVGQFGHRTIPQHKLYRFYAKHGFRFESLFVFDRLYMRYNPKGIV